MTATPKDSDIEPMTLTEFLLARIAEDEARAWRAHDLGCPDLQWYRQFGKPHTGPECDGCAAPSRVLADCKAKKEIVEEFTPFATATPQQVYTSRLLFSLLASVYADHPGYREDWKP